MGRKVGLSLEDVVDAAAAIADRDGLEAASLRAVADELGIKTPSLYNHVAGLAGLRRELAMHAAQRLVPVMEAAISEADPATVIRRVAIDYRRFALDHPGLYQAMLPAPKPGEDDELYAAMAAPVAVLADALTAAGVDPDRAIHYIRTLRAFAHGFIDLEMKDGFGMPEDIATSFDHAIDVVISGVLGEHRVAAGS
jgi:AcrR family transcriptional regulator